MSGYLFYQVDAFAEKNFRGNQACVMPLDNGFLPDDIMLAIAAENNVAETAFIVPITDNRWKLRWFTPAVEVPLCGHATLAAAHVLYEHLEQDSPDTIFETVHSGELRVRRVKDGYEMDFPRPEVSEIEVEPEIAEALGANPIAAFSGPFYGAVFEAAEQIRNLTPDLSRLKDLGPEGDWDRGNFGCVAVDDSQYDVVSRFFAPGSGIDEDPATGSWHCMLAAMMSPRLNKDRLNCFQAYPGRGADIVTELKEDRVLLTGQAKTVITGKFFL